MYIIISFSVKWDLEEWGESISCLITLRMRLDTIFQVCNDQLQLLKKKSTLHF